LNTFAFLTGAWEGAAAAHSYSSSTCRQPEVRSRGKGYVYC